MTDYIDNKKFEYLIQAYKAGDNDVEEELFEMFNLLIMNIINSYKFKVDREDAVQECFLLILKVLKNFDKENGAAFNYFTTIILNNLRFLYTKNRNYKRKMEEYTSFMLGSPPDPLIED